MGENDRLERQPGSGLLPNGLLPNEAASVFRSLDCDRWSVAEQRTSELLKCIKPNKPSEDLRSAVANYVQRLVMKCFPCEVFTFGSVPLKTYLPDGDIDLTAFSNNKSMKETWAHQVRDTLQSEEKNENAEFRVKEVQFIQAEVKIIKCLVENIVVDISFNQLGGLCTLCFLEEVDNLISQEHLFKRSIILIKAWCYYESRVLGAHHGLISTYALETLVLYMFHVFNNSFSGPLEVLYRFLEFFSKFDWDNFCVSLWGPVPISSLPDVTAEPPRKDGGKLLLSKQFLEACSTVYAVYPTGQENQSQPFPSKYFNVIDPLRVNNNLGRSVSKGNFFRIRSAFAFGAKKLARLLDCPKEDICYEVNQFFMNTWDRHGNGHRPDAPRSGLLLSRVGQVNGSENICSSTNVKSPLHDSASDSTHSFETTCRSTDGGLNVSEKSSSSKSSRICDQTRNTADVFHGGRNDKNLKSMKPENLAVDLGKYLFVRTRSSPDLTDDYSDKGRREKVLERGSSHSFSTKSDNSHRKVPEVENLLSQSSRSSNEQPFSAKYGVSRSSLDYADSKSVSSSIHDVGIEDNGEDSVTSLGSQEMRLEEQDQVNMIAASAMGFGGHTRFPGHIPIPFPSSVLPSMGYFQSNIPLMESPWGPNFQFPQGLVSPQMAHYISAADLPQSTDGYVDSNNECFVPPYLDIGNCGYEFDNGVFEMNQTDDPRHVPSTSYDVGHLAVSGSSRNSQRLRSDSQEENHMDDFIDRRLSRTLSSVRPSTARSGSSDASWEEPSSKMTRMVRERKGKKSTLPSIHSGRSKSFPEHLTTEVDTDTRELIVLPNHSQQISESSAHLGPLILGNGSCERPDNSGNLPFTFYPTGPPVPFVTMLPFYKISAEAGNPDISSGSDANISDHSRISPKGFVPSERLMQLSSTRNEFTDSTGPKCDILNSDFASHWQNLLYGRSCQNSGHPSPLIYPSPVMIPPVYLQGRFPMEAPGRPLPSNMNFFTQLMSCGPRILPIAPVPSVSGRATGTHKQYIEDVSRHRSGTGTYLPSPKAYVQERNMNRKGNYAYGRNDHHGDREGNWNTAKLRSGNRSNNRNQLDRTARTDRIGGNENRSWSSQKHKNFPTSQNGPLHVDPIQSNSPNLTYGIYPIPSISSGAVSSKEPPPPAVMFYPYDHTLNYPPPERIEFGSLGSVGFPNLNESNQSSHHER